MLNYPSRDRLYSQEFELLTGGSVPESPGLLRTRFSMQGLRSSEEEGRDGELPQGHAEATATDG